LYFDKPTAFEISVIYKSAVFLSLEGIQGWVVILNLEETFRDSSKQNPSRRLLLFIKNISSFVSFLPIIH